LVENQWEKRRLKIGLFFGFLVVFIVLLSRFFLIGHFPIKKSFAETIEEEVSSTSENSEKNIQNGIDIL
jgi:hypothetical protein